MFDNNRVTISVNLTALVLLPWLWPVLGLSAFKKAIAIEHDPAEMTPTTYYVRQPDGSIVERVDPFAEIAQRERSPRRG